MTVLLVRHKYLPGITITKESRGIVSSGMLRRVALVRTDVSEEPSASFIRVTRIGELRRLLVTATAVPSSSILVTLMKEELSFSETSVLTRAKRRNIPEDGILHSHRRENLKSYMESRFHETSVQLSRGCADISILH
jgi:hypothetical protein